MTASLNVAKHSFSYPPMNSALSVIYLIFIAYSFFGGAGFSHLIIAIAHPLLAVLVC